MCPIHRSLFTAHSKVTHKSSKNFDAEVNLIEQSCQRPGKGQRKLRLLPWRKLAHLCINCKTGPTGTSSCTLSPLAPSNKRYTAHKVSWLGSNAIPPHISRHRSRHWCFTIRYHMSRKCLSVCPNKAAFQLCICLCTCHWLLLPTHLHMLMYKFTYLDRDIRSKCM